MRLRHLEWLLFTRAHEDPAEPATTAQRLYVVLFNLSIRCSAWLTRSVSEKGRTYMRPRLFLLFATLAVSAATTLALSLREVSPVLIGKDNQATYGVSVEITRLKGPMEQYWGIPPGDESGWTYCVKIVVPKEVEGRALRDVDVSVSTIGPKRVQITTPIALKDEGSRAAASVFMNSDTIRIASVSVDYGSMDFFYSIDLRSYFPDPEETDGANKRPEGTEGKCPPSKPSQPPSVPHP